MEELVSLAFSMWLALDQLFWINVFWASHIACDNSLSTILKLILVHKSRQSIDHYIISPPHDTQFPLETLVWLAPILNSNEYKGTSKWHDQSSPWIRSVQVVRAVLRAWMITNLQVALPRAWAPSSSVQRAYCSQSYWSILLNKDGDPNSKIRKQA